MRPPDATGRGWRARWASRWAAGSSLAPALGVAVLSKFTCSMCLAVYAGLLSSVGLGFAATDRGFIALTAVLLALGTASIAWSARRHRRSAPMAAALGGAMIVMAGRLRADTATVRIGTAVILAASLWNLWLSRRPARTLVQITARDRVPDRATHSL